ncbi:MAG: hypothetical protein ACRD2H_03260 [Terriglobales bacterium]
MAVSGTIFGGDDPHYVAPSERRRYTGKERDPESGLGSVIA